MQNTFTNGKTNLEVAKDFYKSQNKFSNNINRKGNVPTRVVVVVVDFTCSTNTLLQH